MGVGREEERGGRWMCGRLGSGMVLSLRGVCGGGERDEGWEGG